MNTPTPQNRIPVNIEDEMKRSYMDYAMSVIIGRALPDVRDGLKPAHRRVLYAMRQMGLASNRAYRKCAKIVGEVIGNYHPHGDAPAYDTLVRLAQVRAEDHMEADLMFTTLMGDQVEPRRKFIEDNALDVKNLDI